jgi:hypothetical protein
MINISADSLDMLACSIHFAGSGLYLEIEYLCPVRAETPPVVVRGNLVPEW